MGFILPVFVYLVLISLYPLAMSLRMSFYDVVAKREAFIGLAHYKELLRDNLFWQAARQTFYFCGVSVVVHLLVGLEFALLLNRKNLKRRNLLRGLQFIPWLFPPAVTACIWILIYQSEVGALNVLLRKLNLSNLAFDWLSSPKTALTSVAVVEMWSFYPFFTLMLLAGLQNIPYSLYEAARIDGAGMWSRFWCITLPLLKPVILTTCLLDVIWNFRFFDLIWIMTLGGPARSSEVLSTYLYKAAFYDFNFGYAGAIGGFMIIFMLPFVIGYLVFYSSE